MKEIIEKLEKASGPSRELDMAIYIAIGATPPDGNDLYWTDPGKRTRHYESLVPLYTSSIDAALTLVPEGWQWQSSNRALKPHTGRAYIHNRELICSGIGGVSPNPKYRGAEATAATPAIALCIAALRARSDGGEG